MKKKPLALVSFLFFVLSCYAKASFPTASSSSSSKTDLVVVMMIDGGRQKDVYATKGKFIQSLIAQGVAFNGQDTFPTETVVNFASLATGSYPAKHGITGGKEYFDASFKPVSMAGADFGVPTIFEVLEKVGRRSVSIGVKGRDVLIYGKSKSTLVVNGREIFKTDPTVSYEYRYSTAVSDPKFPKEYRFGWNSDDRVAHTAEEVAYGNKVRMISVTLRKALDEISKDPKKNEVSYIGANFATTDWVGHSNGAFHPLYTKSIEDASEGMNFFVDGLKKIFPHRRITFVVSADHGFFIPPKQVKTLGLEPDSSPDPAFIKFFSGIEFHSIDCGGVCVGFYIRNPAQYGEVLRRLKAEQKKKEGWADRIYTSVDVKGADGNLKDMHSLCEGRTAHFVVDLKHDWSVTHHFGHGNNDPENFAIPLVFSGAGVPKRGIVNETHNLIDVAPTALALLGYAKANEWDGQVIESAVSK